MINAGQAAAALSDAALEAALLVAHEARDPAALTEIYMAAAARAADDDTRAFLLTHANVFALEAGHPQQGAIQADLIALGRDTAPEPPAPPKR